MRTWIAIVASALILLTGAVGVSRAHAGAAPSGSVRFSSSQTECDAPPANADFLHMSAAALARFGIAPRPATGDLTDWLATAQASKTRVCLTNHTPSGVQPNKQFAPLRAWNDPTGYNEAAYEFYGVTSYQNHGEFILNCGISSAYATSEAYHYTGLFDDYENEMLTAGVDTVYSGSAWHYYLSIQDFPDDTTPFHVKSISCGDRVAAEVWSWGGGAWAYMKIIDITTGYYATYHNASYIPANPTAWFGEETFWDTRSIPVANDGYGFEWSNDYGYIWNGTKWGWGVGAYVFRSYDVNNVDLAQCGSLNGTTSGGPFTFENWFVHAI